MYVLTAIALTLVSALQYTANLVVDFVRRKRSSFRSKEPEDAVEEFLSTDILPPFWTRFDVKDRFYQDAKPYDEQGGLHLPRGACKLSKNYRWAFDLHDPTIREAIAWCVDRVHEHFLQGFVLVNSGAAQNDSIFIVQFPGPDWMAVGTGQKAGTGAWRSSNPVAGIKHANAQYGPTDYLEPPANTVSAAWPWKAAESPAKDPRRHVCFFLSNGLHISFDADGYLTQCSSFPPSAMLWGPW